MKVSNILQNAVSSVMQNLQQPPLEGAREKPSVPKVKDDSAATAFGVTENHPENSGDQKVNIPSNFKPLIGLTAREQAFFEDLFPRARKEIRAYMNQQQEVAHEKGSLVDVKG